MSLPQGGAALVRELVGRDWLTPYQANQLLAGRGAALVLGPYLVLERLGEGATGQVFKARHVHMRRVVAVKVIRPELLTDAEVVARFYREIQVISRLTHPHVVHAYDAGPVGRTHLLAMEYVEGVTWPISSSGMAPWPPRKRATMSGKRPWACNTPTKRAWSIETSSRAT